MLGEKPDREINQVYILVAEGHDGKEGIVGTMPPFMVSNKKMADLLFEQFKPQLKKQIKEQGIKKVKLVRFCFKETVEELE